MPSHTVQCPATATAAVSLLSLRDAQPHPPACLLLSLYSHLLLLLLLLQFCSACPSVHLPPIPAATHLALPSTGLRAAPARRPAAPFPSPPLSPAPTAVQTRSRVADPAHLVTLSSLLVTARLSLAALLPLLRQKGKNPLVSSLSAAQRLSCTHHHSARHGARAAASPKKAHTPQCTHQYVVYEPD